MLLTEIGERFSKDLNTISPTMKDNTTATKTVISATNFCFITLTLLYQRSFGMSMPLNTFVVTYDLGLVSYFYEKSASSFRNYWFIGGQLAHSVVCDQYS